MEPESEPKLLLGLSEQLLRQSDYSGCRKYALLAQQCDPYLVGTNQILAVADVILASQTLIHNNNKNYYSILQLNPLCQNPELIKKHFKRLLFLLNPVENEFSLAREAFTHVREAWSVLSDPTKKAEYDEEMERYYQQKGKYTEEVSEAKFGNDGGESFWTACPYCYYVYEYERVYVDCCLRCQNCGRGFHGVVIQSPPPVVAGMDQYYICFGFFPLGYSGNGESEVGGKNGAPGSNADEFVEISDDSEDSSGELEREVGFKEKLMNVKRRKAQKQVRNCDKRSDQDGFVMQGREKTEVSNVAKERPIVRRKTVARNTKKIMGTGIRGRRVELLTEDEGKGKVDLNVEAGKEVGEIERGSGGGFVIGGVEYFEGDDDILVGLPIVDD